MCASVSDIDATKKASTWTLGSILPSWLQLSLRFHWNSGSMELLSEAEEKLLQRNQIWTLTVDSDLSSQNCPSNLHSVNSSPVDRTPIVLLHSVGTGIGLWVLNLSSLSQGRKVYAFDLLGFGKSSRCQFSSNPYVAEIEWVESIEEWAVSMGLEVFNLLGHGLGGFLAASYALRYPKRVGRLILVEPWGVAERPVDFEIEPRHLPLWVRALASIVRPFNPLAALRIAGPWAYTLMRHLRPDLGEKFSSDKTTSEAVYNYVYQCNIRTPASGETAFRTLGDAFGWAHNPLVRRIGRLPINIGITVIHGARSWLDPGIGELIASARVTHLAALGAIDATQPVDTWSPQAKLISGHVDVHIFPQAGHHVYSDQASMFNELINRILFEDNLNLMQSCDTPSPLS